MPSTEADLIAGIPARRGHFAFESGHHGDLWLDLDALFSDPEATELAAAQLSELLRPIQADIICGAMTGGALLGQVVARQLGTTFACTERTIEAGKPVYTLPTGQDSIVSGQTVVLVDDVINAGSATSGTHRAVTEAGGKPVAIGAIIILGNAIDHLADQWTIPVLAPHRHPNNLWTPPACPLCATGIPLSKYGTF